MRKTSKAAVANNAEGGDLCRCSYCHSFTTNILPRLTKGRPLGRALAGARDRKRCGNDVNYMHDNSRGVASNSRGVVVISGKVYRGPFHERQNKRCDELDRRNLIRNSNFSRKFYFRVGNPGSLAVPVAERQRKSSTGSEFDESTCSLECSRNIPTAQQLVLDKLRNELDELQSTNQRLEGQRLALFDTMDHHLSAARQRIRARLREETLKRDKVEARLRLYKKRDMVDTTWRTKSLN